MSEERLEALENYLKNYGKFVEEQTIQIEMLKEKNKELMERIDSIEDRMITGLQDNKRYNLNEAYDESFFDWSNNASQQKILAEYYASKLVKEFQPKYVLDVGCGSGQWLDEYRKHSVKTKGIEGSINAWKTMSEETKEVVIQWDLRDPREQDNQDYNIDFVQSFEVAEHIEEDYANVFIYNITKDDPDVILLTAAPPGQGGHSHVNCQEIEYWMNKMKNKGYIFNQELLNKIKSWGIPKECPDWWPHNLMVFV